MYEYNIGCVTLFTFAEMRARYVLPVHVMYYSCTLCTTRAHYVLLDVLVHVVYYSCTFCTTRARYVLLAHIMYYPCTICTTRARYVLLVHVMYYSCTLCTTHARVNYSWRMNFEESKTYRFIKALAFFRHSVKVHYTTNIQKKNPI